MNPQPLTFSSLAQASDALARMTKGGTPVSAHGWTWGQVLAHCAQSIEYSMTGFPRPKPVWFQRTLGATALRMFMRKGRMRHGLDAAIPGAPAIAPDTDPGAALTRLQRAIADFGQWTGPLKPHFAYGALDKQAYDRAQAMHLADHLSAFQH